MQTNLHFECSMPLQRKGISRKQHVTFFIEKLSSTNIREAESLRNKIFHDLDIEEKQLLKVSLMPAKHSEICFRNNIDSLSYWVAREQNNLDIIGLTGLYTEIEDDPDVCWLGWFCVENGFRGFGIGEKLLRFSIERAEDMGKKWLHVYTYDLKTYRPAINLYKKYGFAMYNEAERVGNKKIYLKRKINEGDFACAD